MKFNFVLLLTIIVGFFIRCLPDILRYFTCRAMCGNCETCPEFEKCKGVAK